MKEVFKSFSLIISTLLCIFSLSPLASAQVVKGQAYIENGNITKAAADARKDAMRSFVESELGVKIDSTTEVVNSVLVRDSIIAKSDGYVLVKKVISEGSVGQVYEVTLDLEANKNMIETAATDLPGRLKAISEDSTRSGINVAIVGDNAGASGNTAYYNDYFVGMLKNIGFRAEVNDDVVKFLGSNVNTMNEMSLNAEVRRIGRLGDRSAANSIIRGHVGLDRRAEKIGQGSYRAIAYINCEMIGYDNNAVDVATGHYSYVASNPVEAERMALETALKVAAETLGQQALQTVQTEFRGGVHNIKATLIFTGVNGSGDTKNAIVNGLQGANCRIIRSAFTTNGEFQAFVETTDYNTLEEVKNGIIKSLQGSFPRIIDAPDGGQVGSTKLKFNTWG